MKLPVVDESVAGKRVFVRGDIDVPLGQIQDDGYEIKDDTRLKDIWPTVEYLLKQDCTVLIAGHLGRPAGKEDLSLSSKPVAEWFKNKMGNGQWVIGNKLNNETMGQFNNEVSGICLKGEICGFLVTEKLTVLENLRFDQREETNPSTGSGKADYAKELASLAEVYVNEAFATDYENHASIASVPKFLPHFAGFRLAKEVEVLSDVSENPKRPLLVVIGGAKTDTKLPVIAKMQILADKIIVGGKLVVDLFSYARDQNISLDPEKVLVLPLTADFKDIFAQAIANTVADFLAAGTIVWNGPFGAVEEERWQLGTRVVTDLILQNTRALKIVGGGDTVAFLHKLGLIEKFDWVCSGGGSMLKFLAGEKLPGIEVLLS